MEVDEKPTDTYADIGGLDKQIEELVEAMYVLHTPFFQITGILIIDRM
jgi:ATP-dependent 26S proteasome regulatory subunit